MLTLSLNTFAVHFRGHHCLTLGRIILLFTTIDSHGRKSPVSIFDSFTTLMFHKHQRSLFYNKMTRHFRLLHSQNCTLSNWKESGEGEVGGSGFFPMKVLFARYSSSCVNIFWVYLELQQNKFSHKEVDSWTEVTDPGFLEVRGCRVQRWLRFENFVGKTK